MMMQLKEINSPFHVDTFNHQLKPLKYTHDENLKKEEESKHHEEIKVMGDESSNNAKQRLEEIKDNGDESSNNAKQRLKWKKRDKEGGEGYRSPSNDKVANLNERDEKTTNHDSRRDLMTDLLEAVNASDEEKSGYSYTPTLKCTNLPNPNCVSSMIKIARRNSQGNMPQPSIKSALLYANGQELSL